MARNDNKKARPRVHFAAPYLLNPVHRVTVALVGAGGSGSAMLSCLASIDTALRGLGRSGLFVTVYDPDEVAVPNIGRQLFTRDEVGLNKATALVSRFNRCFGTDWEAVPEKFDMSGNGGYHNIVITCTDNTASRMDIGRKLQKKTGYNDENTTYYWLDLGNTQNSGQVFLGSTDAVKQPASRRYEAVGHLPLVTEEFDLTLVDEKDSGPSCSLAEALRRQDLFINRSLASLAGSLLWKLLRGEEALSVRGFYLNLGDYRCLPVRI